MIRRDVAVVVSGALLLSGCGAVGRLKQVGRAPALSAVDSSDAPWIEESLGRRGGPRRDAPANPADLSVALAPPAAAPATASLFRSGAGAFLGDQRAARTGDILTVRINVADKAEVGNSTARSRGGSEAAGVSALLGLEKLLPGSLDPSKLAATDSKSDYNGSGTISRSETINMTMSAIVTGVLPNGNLIIRGRQEIRVNYELRELIMTGIVRPQDIGRDNSIRHTQIAEARISYGGRGQLTQAQQARWGQQIYDALFPF
ncbi:flagellar basal body L-ring protein FlgH [Sphingomonas sp. CFBP 13720]|uniref:flagellar basal body L-ring protein FlgH n=1 Tax=Sphingomonas sp. CFBP 13720 TaxID=2775302 RepID=UPI00177C7069|nr:flagellar basal body L-ring protein FlgH [Sphingomonas sp. CFBP 13720]MBD8678429.1 flagellar basal body L-ring protein FlgH [Sphingomonas sp. CFBP 13720]